MDAHSKYPEVVSMSGTTSSNAIRELLLNSNLVDHWRDLTHSFAAGSIKDHGESQ